MQQAPPEAGLASLFPQDARSLDVREREFFIVACTWSDIVRSTEPPERHAFDHPTWHYRDFFWKQQHGHAAVDVPDIHVNAENALERLGHFPIRR